MDEEIESGADESFAGDQSRRSILKKAAISGAVAWAAPTVLSASGAAAASVGGNACSGITLPMQIATAGAGTLNDPGQIFASGAQAVCFNGAPGTLTLSGDSAGTSDFQADDTVIIRITRPDASVQLLFYDMFGFGQYPTSVGGNGCADGAPYGTPTAGNDWGSGGNGSAINLTPFLLPSATTPNIVEVFVWNCQGGQGYSDMWLS